MTTDQQIVATLTLPARFWHDHSYRCSGEYPVGTIVEQTTYTVTVKFTQIELENFETDADYYAYCARSGEWNRADDPHLWGIGQSAIRAMEALAKQRG